LIFFISGVGVRSFFEISETVVLLGLVIAVITFVVFWKNKIALIVILFVFTFISGVEILDKELEKIKNVTLAGKNFQGRAEIIKAPEKKDGYQKIIVNLEKEREKVLVNASSYPEYSFGEKVEISCALKVPENKNEAFDYKMYLAKDGIKYICDKAKLEKIENGKNGSVYAFILKIKNKLEGSVLKSIPQPEAALANGMLFGGTGSMSQSVQESFSRTGMTHIVAVSGYNVTIIAEYLVLFGIFLGLWRNQALWVAIFGIFLFVAMIGFPSSAVRAGMMGAVLIWAIKNGRLSDSFNAIIFTGAVMLLFNPMLLRWDVGFQLSFLATLGIVSLSPLAERISLRKHNPMGISEIIFLSICAQIFVLPVIIYNFHTISLVSLLANLLVLPIIPFSMMLSFLAAIFGIFIPPALNVFAWLAYLPLYYEIETIKHLSNFSWASRTVEGFGTMAVVVYYVFLICFIYILKRYKELRVLAVGLVFGRKPLDKGLMTND